MNVIEIEIGGVEYTVKELPLKRNAQWRKALEEELQPAIELMEQSQSVELTAGNASAGIGILVAGKDLLMSSPDTVLAMLFDYSPELLRDRARIENEAYESEVWAAFFGVVTRLAFPFGSIAKIVNSLQSGTGEQQEA